MRRLRLGVDMDGVLIDNDPVWAAYFDSKRTEHGHANACPSPAQTWDEKSELCRDCFRVCINDPALLSRAPLMAGVLDGLRYLHRIADLYLVTHRRPELEPTIVELLVWHDLLSFFTELRVGFTPKLQVCQKLRLDALVDDGPRNIEELTGSPVLPIIFNQNYNQHVTGQRVYGWGDVCRFVNLWRLGGFRNVAPPKGL